MRLTDGRLEPTWLSRRRLLVLLAAAPTLAALRASPAHAASRLVIHPREDWADGLEPRGPMPSERPGDVRFLLVHHTETTNDYSRAEVPSQLRGFFGYHTGTKGWNDIAYNFLVDRYGGVWEGRKGSLQGPVRGDATGGSQGFDQLACFIGNHVATPPTPAAQAAMVALLAHLASRYGIHTGETAMTTFVSRGSNRYAKGTRVTAHTISGHRDMSETTCPGNAAYALLPQWRRLVARAAPAAVHPVVSKTSAPSPSAAATSPAAQRESASAPAPARTSPTTSVQAVPASHPSGTAHREEVIVGASAVGVAGMVIVGGRAWWRARR